MAKDLATEPEEVLEEVLEEEEEDLPMRRRHVWMPGSLTASRDQGLRGLGGDGPSRVLGWRAGPDGGEGGAEIGASSTSGCGGGYIACLAPTTSASATGLEEDPEEELEGEKGPSSSTELARRNALGLGAARDEGGE